MRSTDHQRIAEAVSRIVSRQCSEMALANLKDGSVLPDRESYLKRVAHHKRKGRWQVIRAYVFEARKDYLGGNLTRSALHLGIAFHFIADAMCPPSESSTHSKWEAEIAHIKIPKVRPAVIMTPADIDKRVIGKLRQPCPAPYIALKASIELCAGLMELTWRPLNERTAVDEQVIKTLRTARFTRRLLKSICAVAIIACSGILFVQGSFIAGFGLVLLGIGFSFAVIDELGNARKHGQILDWYGLE